LVVRHVEPYIEAEQEFKANHKLTTKQQAEVNAAKARVFSIIGDACADRGSNKTECLKEAEKFFDEFFRYRRGYNATIESAVEQAESRTWHDYDQKHPDQSQMMR
jgi:hypothetical protein